MQYNIVEPRVGSPELLGPARTIGVFIVLLSAGAIVWAVWQSKRERGDDEEEVKVGGRGKR